MGFLKPPEPFDKNILNLFHSLFFCVWKSVCVCVHVRSCDLRVFKGLKGLDFPKGLVLKILPQTAPLQKKKPKKQSDPFKTNFFQHPLDIVLINVSHL